MLDRLDQNPNGNATAVMFLELTVISGIFSIFIALTPPNPANKFYVFIPIFTTAILGITGYFVKPRSNVNIASLIIGITALAFILSVLCVSFVLNKLLCAQIGC